MIDDNNHLEESSLKNEKGEKLYEHYRIVADPKQTLIRIDKFLMDRLERVTRNRVQSAIKEGSIRINDEVVKSNYKIRPGDIVTVFLNKPPDIDLPIEPFPIPLDIRYEDDDLMIIHKPPGLVVHPGVGNHNNTLVNGLAYYFKDKDLPFKDGFQSRPGIVHRIDKDTSGLMVIAKNPHAMTHLNQQFFKHTIQRRYYALIWGSLEEPEGTININVGRDPKDRMLMKTFPEGELGKNAVTHYKVIEDLYYVSLIECRLETGRTHQIRIHMKSLGHPLFNDERYKGNRIVKGTIHSKYRQFVENCFKVMPRQGLHAKSLGFVHPTTGENMFFDSDLPHDFQSCLLRWQKYLAGRKLG